MTPTLHLIQNVLLGVVAVLAALALFSGYVARRVTRAFPPEGRFVDIDGDRIHYVEYGNGPPIVFVHGLAGQWRNFAYLPLTRLAQQHRVILIDRPGAGRSLRGAASQANVFAQARTVAAFIDALQLDKPVLVGHYWMRGTPQLLARRVACVDYSAGRGEPLVAYRWDGETDLVPGHFVAAK